MSRLSGGILRAIGAMLALCLLALAFYLIFDDAGAHDFWINHSGYKGADGYHCCGKDDCFVVLETDVKISVGGYQLSTGELVPFSDVIQSEDENYWRCKRDDGSRRCFFAPMKAS